MSKSGKTKKSGTTDSESESELPSSFLKAIEHIVSSFTEAMSNCVEKLTKSMENTVAKLVEDHHKSLNEINEHVSKLESRLCQMEAQNHVEFPQLGCGGKSQSWAGLAAKPSLIIPTNPAPPRSASTAKIVKGSKSSGTIKSVPRPLVVFVGRLAKDTSEADLAEYLSDSGIPSTKCVKLVSKDPKREYSSSAFRVSCDEKYKHNLYDESSWPEGAEVRDWVFINK